MAGLSKKYFHLVNKDKTPRKTIGRIVAVPYVKQQKNGRNRAIMSVPAVAVLRGMFLLLDISF